MIEYGTGNLLDADTDAIVNTVNTVGVMGKGIALQVKRAYPDAFAAYRAAYQRGDLHVGQMHVHDRGVLGARRYVVNFPTKRDWRQPSRLADIEVGLVDLVRVVTGLGIDSVAVPALGCGNGGLDWDVVRPRIVQAVGALPSVRWVIYPPAGAPAPAAMPTNTQRPALTPMRALVLTAMARYSSAADAVGPGNGVSELEVQKLTYFLHQFGAPLPVQFVRGRYGPYAPALAHVLNDFEGHYTVGFGDRSARVTDLQPIAVSPEAQTEAAAVLDSDPASRAMLNRLMTLVEGFETPYSVELLATVHFAANEIPKPTSVAEISARVAQWSQRKARLFTPRHVALAAERLRVHGLLCVQ